MVRGVPRLLRGGKLSLRVHRCLLRGMPRLQESRLPAKRGLGLRRASVGTPLQVLLAVHTEERLCGAGSWRR